MRNFRPLALVIRGMEHQLDAMAPQQRPMERRFLPRREIGRDFRSQQNAIDARMSKTESSGAIPCISMRRRFLLAKE
jgi:hypothetical protein